MGPSAGSAIPHGELNSLSLCSGQGVLFSLLSHSTEKSPPGENHEQQKPTSLNSGFSVFFFTAVLCFDFLSSSGFK